MGDAFQARAGGPSDLSRSASQPEALIAIAERCEAAAGPDRELDAAIARAAGWRQRSSTIWGIGAPHWFNKDNLSQSEVIGHWHGPDSSSLPHFSTSLDAAMTLVPEGDNHDLSFERTVRGGPDFKLWQVRYSLDTVENDPDETGPMCLGEADTLPLAICAAALRARASGERR